MALILPYVIFFTTGLISFHRHLRGLRSRDIVILGIDSWSAYYGNAVGFCGRYWNKPSYTRRKNYNLILDLVKLLVNNNTPIIFLGSGWENPFLKIIFPRSLSVSLRLIIVLSFNLQCNEGSCFLLSTNLVHFLS